MKPPATFNIRNIEETLATDLKEPNLHLMDSRVVFLKLILLTSKMMKMHLENSS